MNKSIITARNVSARRNALSTIAFNAWEATNLTFTWVILTFTLYLKLLTRYDRQFQAANLTSTREVLTFPLYLKMKTCVAR